MFLKFNARSISHESGKGHSGSKTLCNFLKKLQVSCITVIRFHALVTAFAVKYVRRRSLPGKSSRKSKRRSRNFFCEQGYTRGLRNESPIKSRPCALVRWKLEFGRFFEGFIMALSGRPRIGNRIRNGAAIIIHPPRLQTFPAIKSTAEV